MQPDTQGFDDFSSHRFSRHLNEYRKTNKKRSHLFYNGIRYASKAEISCVKALEAYCDWEPVEGETYQIPIGHGKYCDFRVDDIFIEFHPIILSRAVHAPAYKLLQKALRSAKESVRRDLKAALKIHLFLEYSDKRDWSIRLHHSQDVCDAELIVVPSSLDFYRYVIKRFAVGKIPKERDFVRMFKEGSFDS